eukprot:scaffold3713_cov372-Prasinococcus_capsulatus_cf.AAC.19
MMSQRAWAWTCTGIHGRAPLVRAAPTSSPSSPGSLGAQVGRKGPLEQAPAFQQTNSRQGSAGNGSGRPGGTERAAPGGPQPAHLFLPRLGRARARQWRVPWQRLLLRRPAGRWSVPFRVCAWGGGGAGGRPLGQAGAITHPGPTPRIGIGGRGRSAAAGGGPSARGFLLLLGLAAEEEGSRPPTVGGPGPGGGALGRSPGRPPAGGRLRERLALLRLGPLRLPPLSSLSRPGRRPWALSSGGAGLPPTARPFVGTPRYLGCPESVWT